MHHGQHFLVVICSTVLPNLLRDKLFQIQLFFFPDRARLRACDSDMAFPAHADHYNMLNVLPDFWVAETELWPYENDHFVLHICKLCGGKAHFAILLFPT